ALIIDKKDIANIEPVNASQKNEEVSSSEFYEGELNDLAETAPNNSQNDNINFEQNNDDENYEYGWSYDSNLDQTADGQKLDTETEEKKGIEAYYDEDEEYAKESYNRFQKSEPKKEESPEKKKEEGLSFSEDDE
ncbi:hypothetical protein N9N67_06055, partial [Bacteriovoracaceae bacterium]|nr:hypothetical protein [Bacteriovoracaceae bacterium]